MKLRDPLTAIGGIAALGDTCSTRSLCRCKALGLHQPRTYRADARRAQGDAPWKLKAHDPAQAYGRLGTSAELIRDPKEV